MTGVKIRLAPTYVRPDDPVLAALWDRYQKADAHVKDVYADGYSEDWYVPPALQPRAARLLLWIERLWGARVRYGTKIPGDEIELADWIHIPLYSTLDLSGFADPNDPDYVPYTILRKRKKGRRYQPPPPAPGPPQHDHDDGRWYSDCPACPKEQWP